MLLILGCCQCLKLHSVDGRMLVNDKSERICKDAGVTCSRYYPGICKGRTEESNEEVSQGNWCPSLNSKAALFECDVRAPLDQLPRSEDYDVIERRERSQNKS